MEGSYAYKTKIDWELEMTMNLSIVNLLVKLPKIYGYKSLYTRIRVETKSQT